MTVNTDVPLICLSGDARTNAIQMWKETGETSFNNFNWLKTTIQVEVGMVVVYMESDVQEDHRAAIVTKVFDRDVNAHLHVVIQFRRFQDSMFEFTGKSLATILAFIRPIEHYELHFARRFCYYGPPPRVVRFHSQTVATKILDLGSRHLEASFPEYRVGFIFSVHASGGELLRGMFLGAIRSYHCDNSDWKVLAVFIPQDVEFFDFVEDLPAIAARLSATTVSDFVKMFAADKDCALDVYSGASPIKLDTSQLIRHSFSVIDEKLNEDPTWRPQTLLKVWKDIQHTASKKSRKSTPKTTPTTAKGKKQPAKEAVILSSDESEGSPLIGIRKPRSSPTPRRQRTRPTRSCRSQEPKRLPRPSQPHSRRPRPRAWRSPLLQCSRCR
jgi:hypothetical protein